MTPLSRRSLARDLFALAVFVVLGLHAHYALAEDGAALTLPAITLAAAPAPLVTLTTPLAVIALLSLLAAYVTQGVSSGQIFGIVTIPKTWLPLLTVIGTFLSTFIAQIVAEGSTLSGVHVFNAFVAGMFMLIAPATGTALHHHLNSPGQNLAATAALKSAGSAAVRAAGKALPAVLLVFLLHCAAGAAAVVPAASCVASVIEDAVAGMSIPQIVAAAGPGCVTDAEDVVAILLGSTDARLPQTTAYAQAKAIRAVQAGGKP